MRYQSGIGRREIFDVDAVKVKGNGKRGFV